MNVSYLSIHPRSHSTTSALSLYCYSNNKYNKLGHWLYTYLALTLVLNWRLDSNLISSRVYDNLMMIRSVQFIIKAPSIHTPPHPACFNLLLVTHPLTYTHSKAPP